MKKIYLLPLIFTLLLFTSCSVTQQSYSYQHHGTDTLKSNSDFKYVAHNVKGKAKSTIKISLPQPEVVINFVLLLYYFHFKYFT